MYNSLQLALSQFFVRHKPMKSTGLLFKMSTKYTAGLMIIFFFIASANTYFGENIVCQDGKEKVVDSDLRKAYCWIEGSYLDGNLMNGTAGKDHIQPGVGAKHFNKQFTDRISLRHYQWIAPLFLLKALLFFIPKYLWGIFDNGRMSKICNEIDAPLAEFDVIERRVKVERTMRYILNLPGSYHTSYVIKYLFCETLSFLILMFNAYLLNMIFNDFWQIYSPALWAVLHNDFKTWVWYTTRLFPKMAKCDFQMYGSSGTIAYYDTLCVLPLNVVNDKIFLFIYCWYVILMLFYAINTLYKICILLFKRMRIHSICNMAPTMSYKSVKEISKNGQLGLWFFFTSMNRNFEDFTMAEIFKCIENNTGPLKERVTEF